MYVGTGWTDPPPISSAVSLWKNSCFGMSGRDFPMLSTGTSGDLAIAVSYESGPNPIRDGGCGRFAHNLDSHNVVVGGTIFVYATGNAGEDCSWARAHTYLDNLIAHELGHVLGLANATSASCGDYIMGNDWHTASVQPDECETVDGAWDLPNESPDSPPDGTACLPGCTTPIIISEHGNYRLTSPSDGVLFDFDADGVTEKLAWTEPNSGVAFLAMDRNANGRIDSGAELFGDHAKLASGGNAPNGFAVLDELDVNRDGVLDFSDPAWSALILWVDDNHNGQSEANEMIPILASDVLAISTHYAWSGRKDRYGNLFRYKSDVTLTHGVRKFYDVYLRLSDY